MVRNTHNNLNNILKILIKIFSTEFGKSLYTTLRDGQDSQDCLVFTFVKDPNRLENVMREFPQLVPLLLNLDPEPDPDSKNANGTSAAEKVIRSMPTLDHIVNLSGEQGLTVISKAYSTWKYEILLLLNNLQ